MWFGNLNIFGKVQNPNTVFLRGSVGSSRVELHLTITDLGQITQYISVSQTAVTGAWCLSSRFCSGVESSQTSNSNAWPDPAFKRVPVGRLSLHERLMSQKERLSVKEGTRVINSALMRPVSLVPHCVVPAQFQERTRWRLHPGLEQCIVRVEREKENEKGREFVFKIPSRGNTAHCKSTEDSTPTCRRLY